MISFIIWYLNKIKEECMNRTSSKHGDCDKCKENFIQKPQGKENICEKNIHIYFIGIGLIWLRIKTNGKALWKWKGTFEFCKRWAIFLLDEQLFDSQEGLCLTQARQYNTSLFPQNHHTYTLYLLHHNIFVHSNTYRHGSVLANHDRYLMQWHVQRIDLRMWHKIMLLEAIISLRRAKLYR